MSPSPTVAAVVVHYGDPGATRRCLDSLSGLDGVVLVDQPPRFLGDHPAVTRRIATATNVGFAAAADLGVAATSADFVLLLNNDTELAAGAVEALRDALPTLADDVAGACPKVLDEAGARIQSAGGLWFTADGIGFPHGFGEVDGGQFDAMPDGEVGVPSGAAALYRRGAWEEAGGMSEDFFCYCEDGDLGLRMIAAGGRFVAIPRVVVRHAMSASSGAHSAFKAYHVERNHFATVVHVGRGADLAALPLRTLLRLAATARDALLGRGAGAGLARASSAWVLAATLLRAWAGAVAMLPAALRRRQDLQRRHADGRARVARFLAQRRVPLARFLGSREGAP